MPAYEKRPPAQSHQHLIADYRLRRFFFQLPNAGRFIREQHPIQMIDLVLKNASQPSLRFNLDRLPAPALTLHNDFIRTVDISYQARYRKTALRTVTSSSLVRWISGFNTM